MFKCRKEFHKCISISNVCDDQPYCLYHDDEMFCELKSVQCPVPCSCLIYAITCADLPDNILLFHFSSLYLSISIFKSKISSLDIFKHKLENIKFLQLSRNHLSSVCLVGFLRYLILLDVAHNYITEVKQNCFSTSKYLISICLNNNDIINLNKNAFHDLHQVRFLDLSNNPFTDLPSKCFSNLPALKVLNLDNNKFTNIRVNSFFSTNIKLIKTIDYKISCVSSANSFYTSYPAWYISCSDILPRTLMKTMYISISILTICLNILSILLYIMKIYTKQQNESTFSNNSNRIEF